MGPVIGAVAATIGIVSGFFGGMLGAAFLEVVLSRRAAEEVGEHDAV